MAMISAGTSLTHAAPSIPTQVADSTIEHVTVYPDSARVMRRLQVELPAGMSVVRLDYLPNHLDVSQALAQVIDSTASVLLRDLNFQHDASTIEDHPGAIELRESIDANANTISELQQQQEFWNRRLAFANALTESFAEGFGTREDAGALQEQIESTWAFYETTHGEVRAKTRELDAEIQALFKQQEDLRKRYAELLASLKGLGQSVELLVEAQEAGEVSFALFYGVRQCSWQPVYEIRANPAQDEVTIRYQAQVSQQSGEAWEGVTLTLSTAAANRGSHLPELHPIYLNPIEAVSQRKGELRAMSLDSVGMAPAMSAEMAAPVFESGYSSFQVTLPQAFSMQSGKDRKQSVIAEQTVAASFWSVVAPTQDVQVYLAAEVTPTFEMPLLAGESVLFVDQQMVGRSFLGATPMGESIELALGLNENLTVERKSGEIMQEERGLFGKSKRINRQYFTTVRNASEREQRIRVKDQFPVSQNEKITVNAMAPKASEIEMEAHNGRFYWDLLIPAGQARELETRFEVNFPEDWNVPQHF